MGAQKLMQQEDGPDVRQAVNYLAKFGVASNQPAYFMLYTDIASQCFSLTEKEEIREKTLSWAMDDTLDQDSGIDELMTKLKFAQAATAEVAKKSKRWIGDYRPGSRREWDD